MGGLATFPYMTFVFLLLLLAADARFLFQLFPKKRKSVQGVSGYGLLKEVEQVNVEHLARKC